MNKGLKAHLYVTLLYLIVILIAVFQNNNISNEARYVLAGGFAFIQLGVGMLCYLEDYYKEKSTTI